MPVTSMERAGHGGKCTFGALQQQSGHAGQQLGGADAAFGTGEAAEVAGARDDSADEKKNLHSEAEKRRRDRISHQYGELRERLPHVKNADKAAVLKALVDEIHRLTAEHEASRAAQAQELLPLEADEVTVNEEDADTEGTSDEGNDWKVRVVLSSKNRPTLMEEIRDALDSLNVLITRTESVTLGSRTTMRLFLTMESHLHRSDPLAPTTESVGAALQRIIEPFRASGAGLVYSHPPFVPAALKKPQHPPVSTPISKTGEGASPLLYPRFVEPLTRRVKPRTKTSDEASLKSSSSSEGRSMVHQRWEEGF
eukprot:TRINITY_DN292_c0_g2_i1.p1 TRINITY_DN292_c0_g2~~TRINITY_DN292_c0_g2_i1.p1  ORF type:complete len:311 (-),score=71.07 TRINITY_DN292_c0_g2_i1:1346-2278(-)